MKRLPLHESLSVFLLIVILVGLGVVSLKTSDAPPLPSPLHKKTSKMLVVTISGAVSHPGVYHVKKGTSLHSLMKKVEPLPSADLKKISLQQKLKRSCKIIIPEKTLYYITLHGLAVPDKVLEMQVEKGTRLFELIDLIDFADNTDWSVLNKKRYVRNNEEIAVPLKS